MNITKHPNDGLGPEYTCSPASGVAIAFDSFAWHEETATFQLYRHGNLAAHFYVEMVPVFIQAWAKLKQERAA